MKKVFGAQICAKGVNVGPKTRFFFSIFVLKLGSLVFLEIAYNDSFQQCLTCSRGKIHEKNILGPNLGQIGQNRVEN